MTKKLTLQELSLFFSLYITQFLGIAFFTEAMVGILRKNGMPLENLGFIYMLGLFWVFRFLWSPFIDSFKFGRYGHYRIWIIIFQTFMITTLISISLFDLLDNINTVILLCCLVAFFSASQDTALDAFILKTVSKENRPTANALKASGGMISMMLGGGVGLIVYANLGWFYTMILLAFTASVSLIQIIFYKKFPENEITKQKIDYKQYIEFWKGKRRLKWLLFLLLYPITITSAFALSTPMLVDLGWGLDKIGFYIHILGFGIGVLSSFLASFLILKYGRKNILILASIGEVIGIFLLTLLPLVHTNTFIVICIVGFIFSIKSPATVVVSTVMMDESSQKNPGSQFAVQQGVNTLSAVFFSGVSVSLSGVFSYDNIIFGVMVIGLVVVYLAFKIELK